jgi:aspartate racemase
MHSALARRARRGGKAVKRQPAYPGPVKPVVGVLGGMGPMATVDFLTKLIARVPAGTDQEHLPLAIWSNPEIPNRTAALMGCGPSPVPALLDGVARLLDMGAETIAIPCNTAHAFLDQLREATGATFLDMIDATAAAAATAAAGDDHIGILSTRGTRAAGLYAAACLRRGLQPIEADQLDQELLVDVAIEYVKGGGHLDLAARLIETAVFRLVERGATVVIAGCTEIPIVSGRASASVQIIDATDCLAAAVVDAVWSR